MIIDIVMRIYGMELPTTSHSSVLGNVENNITFTLTENRNKPATKSNTIAIIIGTLDFACVAINYVRLTLKFSWPHFNGPFVEYCSVAEATKGPLKCGSAVTPCYVYINKSHLYL